MKLAFKYSLFPVIVFLINGYTYAQTYSERELDIRKHARPVISGHNDTSFFVLYSMSPNQPIGVKRKYEVECFNYEFKSLWRADNFKLDDTYDEKNTVFFHSRMLFLYSEYDNYKAEFAYEIKKQVLIDGSVLEDADTIFRIRTRDENNKLRNPSYGFDCIKSYTKNNLMFIYSNDYKNEYQEGFSFRIMDKDFHLSETKRIELPYSDPLCNISDVLFDDASGKIFLLAKVFDVPDVKKRNVREHKLFSFDLDGNLQSSVDLQLASVKTALVKMKCNDTKIFVMGFIKSEDEDAAGIIFRSINKETFIMANTSRHFFSDSVKFVVNHKSKAYKGLGYNVTKYVITDFIVEDNRIYWMAEYNSFGKSMMASALTSTVPAAIASGIANPAGMLIAAPLVFEPPEYTSCNLLFEELNFDGELISERVIQKYEKDISYANISHLMLQNKSYSCLAYNYDRAKEKRLKKNSDHIETVFFTSKTEGKNTERKIDLKNRYLLTNSCLPGKADNFIFITGNFDNGKMYLTNYNFY